MAVALGKGVSISMAYITCHACIFRNFRFFFKSVFPLMITTQRNYTYSCKDCSLKKIVRFILQKAFSSNLLIIVMPYIGEIFILM
jgi:hypothetical protein